MKAELAERWKRGSPGPPLRDGVGVAYAARDGVDGIPAPTMFQVLNSMRFGK
jgi:hypothetical protein